jgi:hypothetical protein
MSKPPPTQLFVLLVGINKYPAPVTALNGCDKDVKRLKNYLIQHYATVNTPRAYQLEQQSLQIEDYGHLQLCTLLDEQATYHNIIKAFRNHLGRATSKDVVWFHFSGHGTQSSTAEEFLNAIEPTGKDQNLVCYTHTFQREELLLADKELAILLHEIANKPSLPAPPHIVVSLDCCHSGSATRAAWHDAALKTRSVSIERMLLREQNGQAVKARPIETYLDGYFLNNPLELPFSRHLAISACTQVQTAAEVPDGGLFTSGLIEVLEDAPNGISYADLFLKLRATIQRLRPNQLPKFSTLHNFDPYTRFLNGSSLGRPDHYQLSKEHEHWIIQCGIIHGLPTQAKAPVKIQVFASHELKKTIGTFELKSIGPQKSQVNIPAGTLDEGLYFATISHLPIAPEPIFLKGENAPVKKLLEESQKSLFIKFTTAAVISPKIAVEAKQGSYHIYHQQQRRILADGDYNNIKKTIDSLEKIVRWERILRLENPKSKMARQIKLELGIMGQGHKWKRYQAPEIRLYTSDGHFMSNEKGAFVGFMPEVHIQGVKQELFIYLFHLRNNYSINCYDEEFTYRPADYQHDKPVSIPLLKQIKAWGMSNEESHTTSHFKLIATTSPLDYHQLLQSGLSGYRHGRFANTYKSISQDWYTTQISVTLIRSDQHINPSTAVKLAEGQLCILPHPTLKAAVALNTLYTPYSTSSHIHKYFELLNEDIDLVQFQSSPYEMPLNVLEIIPDHSMKDIKLEQNPLEIVLDIPTKDNEIITPMAFDGETFQAIGKTSSSEQGLKIAIEALAHLLSDADQDSLHDITSQTEEKGQHFSLFSSIKIVFVKQKGLYNPRYL